MALRQIEASLGDPKRYNVITATKSLKTGSEEDFKNLVKTKSSLIIRFSEMRWVGYKYEIRDGRFPNFRDGNSDEVRDFFALRIPTDTRLSGSDPVKSIAFRKEPPTHPMHLLILNRKIEEKISSIFHQAFGQYLYVNRAGGADVELFVGDKPAQALPSDPFSPEAMDFFNDEAFTLKMQGDGMRAFATISLNTVAIDQQTVLLIDEPEAFLHPPQARLLGRTIASEGNLERQIFIATHSADVLKGVIESSERPVKIIRITRKSDVNCVSILKPDHVEAISKDPLARYSGILDAIFYKHVILCESDTDCHFYRTILDTDFVSGDHEPDVLFVQTSGKHRMSKLGDVARGLGVPFSMILDVDVLNDKNLFRRLVNTAGAEWNEIEPIWKIVYDAINSQRVSLTAKQLVSAIEETLQKLNNKEITAKDFISEVRESVKSNSPWDHVKRAGRNALPPGITVENFDALLEICGNFGLWIVPVGELEGFCRSISNKKGNDWIVDLLEKRNVETSPELTDARIFLTSIWTRVKSA